MNLVVKTCHSLNGPNGNKQQNRWQLEIDLMTNKIRHLNIVRGIVVQPATFASDLSKANPLGLPVLISEYCDGGDLRRQLNDNRNASGMVESEVRNILHSLTSAVLYLHSLSIIHRDIKPETLAIHLAKDGRRIYKVIAGMSDDNCTMNNLTLCIFQLTDLGHTKPIDFRNMESNLVGKLVYIAPELITTDKYSCSADYWSVGMIAYEVITGCRPFVPHLSLAQWVLRVREKRSEHITIYEDDVGGFVYSKRIYGESHLSSQLEKHLEHWLRLALEWNPKQRGSIFEKPTEVQKGAAPIQVLKFFQQIDDILAKKFLTIFVLTNHRCYSMEITDDTTNDDLFAFIAQEAEIPIDQCHVVGTGEPKEFSKPMELYVDGGVDKPMAFAVQISLQDVSNDEHDIVTVKLPASVESVLTNHEQRMKVHSLRKFASDALHLVRNENRSYKTCLDGWFCLAQQLADEIEACQPKVRQMQCLIYGVFGALELFKQTIDIAGVDSAETHVTCADQHAKIVQNMERLMRACDKITARFESVHRRIRDVFQFDLLVKRNAHEFYDVVNVTRAYDILRNQLINNNLPAKPHFELCQCVYKCLKQRDSLLRNKYFVELQRWESILKSYF